MWTIIYMKQELKWCVKADGGTDWNVCAQSIKREREHECQCGMLTHVNHTVLDKVLIARAGAGPVFLPLHEFNG